jgi:hypothetical protein
MAPKKNKSTATKKTSARTKSKTTAPTEALTQPATLPFPYDVSRKTVRDKLIKFLEEEVAKHAATAQQLKEAERRLGAGMDKDGDDEGGAGGEEESGLEGSGTNEAGHNGGGGDDDEEDNEEDMGMEVEEWNGFDNGLDNPPAKDTALSSKVQAMEESIASLAKGLQTMSSAVANGFKALATANNSGTEGDRGKDTRVDDEGGYESPDDSIMVTGGESYWDELMARYDNAGGKELLRIAKGDLMPEKLYLCIPRDSDLFPDIDLEGQDKLRWDDQGAFVETKNSTTFNKLKWLKALNQALPTPAHFLHAWGWFMILVNYQYQNAPLLSAMMQFGCEVVQYAGNYAWYDCLKIYANLARPILRGGLDTQIGSFKQANFGAEVSKCARLEKARVGPVFAGIAYTGSASGYNRSTPRAVDNTEICRKFNKGECEGSVCSYGRKHACERCRGTGHTVMQCTSAYAPGPTSFASAPNRDSGYRPGSGPLVQPPRYFTAGPAPNFARPGPRGN